MDESFFGVGVEPPLHGGLGGHAGCMGQARRLRYDFEEQQDAVPFVLLVPFCGYSCSCCEVALDPFLLLWGRRLLGVVGRRDACGTGVGLFFWLLVLLSCGCVLCEFFCGLFNVYVGIF